MECFSCESLAGRKPIKPGPIIHDGKYWIVDHAYPSKLVGWLVIVLKRHAEAMHELTSEEYLELQELIRKTTSLLHEELKTKKEYVAFFAEGKGFAHIHGHIIPRAEDLPEELKGPRIFAMLKPEGPGAVGDAKIQDLTLRLKKKFSSLHY